MRTAFIIALLVTTSSTSMITSSATDPPPGYFMVRNEEWNVTAEGTAVKAQSGGCVVNVEIRIGDGPVREFNFRSRVAFSDGCAPQLSIENVTGVLAASYYTLNVTANTERGGSSQTWVRQDIVWRAPGEGGPPVWGTYEYHDAAANFLFWDTVAEGGGWYEQGCSVCGNIHVGAESWGRFRWHWTMLPQGFCGQCPHKLTAHAEAYFQYGLASCKYESETHAPEGPGFAAGCYISHGYYAQ